MDDRMDEILRRLEALEQRVEALAGEREAADEGTCCEPRECPFRSDERRIVDLIVQLTAERVCEMIGERRGPPPGAYAPGPPPHHGHPQHGHPQHGHPQHAHVGPPHHHPHPPHHGPHAHHDHPHCPYCCPPDPHRW